MSPGDVIRIWLTSAQLGGGGAKFKYLICVDPKERRFLGINSEPRRLTPEDNVPISHDDFSELPNETSYIDTSRLIGLTFTEYRDGMEKNGAKEFGCISDAAKEKILEGGWFVWRNSICVTSRSRRKDMVEMIVRLENRPKHAA